MGRRIALAASGLAKSYRLGRLTLEVLKGVDFEVAEGEFVAITGASGSGKSTLLHLLGLLDRADAGTVSLAGRDVSTLSSRQRNQMRCQGIGFVFQFYHLLKELTVLENVLLPAQVNCSILHWPARRRRSRRRARELLEHLGLKRRLRHKAIELSGGERQRVAIARALMNDPQLLLADEPTGNLDSKTGQKIVNLLRRCNEQDGQTIVMVTHDEVLARQADRFVTLRDGLVAS
ncbi:MAG: ABC transporter ATP-binding protein [Planctomycetes bacterium]|nr:ABC transporter ATP-binding protein [Planctomycetota bacterium]